MFGVAEQVGSPLGWICDDALPYKGVGPIRVRSGLHLYEDVPAGRNTAMWSITNHTPYKAKKTWGRDKDGVHEWIVAVKGTYDIKADGTVVLANEQLDPLLAPEYNGEPGVSSLRYDADLVAPKPTTDVVINGTAYAPKGRPSTEFLVSVRVAQIHKVIRVVGTGGGSEDCSVSNLQKPNPSLSCRSSTNAPTVDTTKLILIRKSSVWIHAILSAAASLRNQKIGWGSRSRISSIPREVSRRQAQPVLVQSTAIGLLAAS